MNSVTTVQRSERRLAAGYLASENASRAAVDASQPTSKQMDPLADMYASGGVVEPPYRLHTLAMMPEISDTLFKCVDAMATNIALQGWKLEPPEDNPHPGAPDDPLLAEIDAERKRIKRFLRYVSKDMTLDQVRYRQRRDLEATGNAYLEIIRTGDEIVRIEHLPSYTMRIGVRSKEHVDIVRWERNLETGAWESTTIPHRPRRYIQEQDSVRVWFKEFGDRRIMNCETGQFDDATPLNKRATEVIHTGLYMNGRSPYGIPRWISAAQQAVGRSEAAEKNLAAITSNGIARAMLMMYGAGTPEELESDIRRISELWLAMQRRDNIADLLIVPMAPKEVDAMIGEKPTQPRGELVKLNDLQQQDAMFGKYSEASEMDIIGTFRLPPIAVGKSADYTRSTAETAKRVAQEQVYGPQAKQDDRMFNDLIFPEMGFVWWEFKTAEAPSSDESVAGAVVTALTESAGITPRMARQLAERFLGIKSGGAENPWDDLPAGMVNKWVTQGLIPPPEELLTALGVLDAVDNTPAGKDAKPPEDKSAARARRLQRVLRHQYGDVEAESAATVARLVIRGLLEARKQLEEGDDAGVAG